MTGLFLKRIRSPNNQVVARPSRNVTDAAVRLMSSEQLKAFDSAAEPQVVRESYGNSQVGRACLIASCRLAVSRPPRGISRDCVSFPLSLAIVITPMRPTKPVCAWLRRPRPFPFQAEGRLLQLAFSRLARR